MKCNLSFLIVIFFLSTTWAATGRGACAEEKLRIEKCAVPHQSYIQTLGNITGHEILNQKFMMNFAKFTDKVAKCFGDVHCDPARSYLYFLNAITFAADVIYNKAFSCIDSMKEARVLEDCFAKHTTDYFKAIGNVKTFKQVLDCTMNKLKRGSVECVPNIVDELKTAFLALYDVRHHYKFYASHKMEPIVFDKGKIGTYF